MISIHSFLFNVREVWYFMVHNEFHRDHLTNQPPMPDEDLNIGFIIALSSIISFILLIIILLIVYLLFFNTGSIGNLTSPPSSFNIPESLKVNQSTIKTSELLLLNELPIKEKARYKLSKRFFKKIPPVLKFNNSSDSTTIANTLLARERGINVFYFESWYDQIRELMNKNSKTTLNDSNTSIPSNDLNTNSNNTIINNNSISSRPTSTNEPGASENNMNSTTPLPRNKDRNASNINVYSDLLSENFDDDESFEDDDDDDDDDNDQGEEISTPAVESTSLLPKSIKKMPIMYYASMIRNGYLSKFSNLPTIIPPYEVEDLTEISFTSTETSSTILNFPIPCTNRRNDTVYFETKIYELDPTTTTIAIGLSTKPYPNFLLPGYGQYSVAVDTSGALRMSNRPFANDPDTPIILPQVSEGDVIGIGYKSIQGTVFITHNGKKIVEPIRNLRIEMYPCIGAVGGPCKVQVNLGQMGFVFIEANVKKLGFCENNNEGTIGAPPFYLDVNNDDNSDVILEQGETLPPTYPSEEASFFGSNINRHSVVTIDTSQEPTQVQAKQEPSSRPPSYHTDTESFKDAAEEL